MKAKDLYPGVFSRHAEAYQQRLEAVMARRESRGRMRVVEAIDPQPGQRILDLACGPGTLSRILASRVAPDGEVVGVDLAQGMIELARACVRSNARFEVMDIEDLKFADASFDAASCGHGLQFAPNLQQALGEARRVLRPQAVLGAAIPLAGAGDKIARLVDSVVDRWLPPAPEVIDAAATRATVTDGASLRAAAMAAGFGSAEVEVVEDEVTWESAEQFMSTLMGWWDFAYRVEGAGGISSEAFKREAVAVIRETYPGEIRSVGRNLVLIARAS